MPAPDLRDPVAVTREDRGPMALTGVSALLLTACLFVTAPEAPEPGAPVAQVRSFLESHLQAISAAALAGSVGFGALTVLTVGLWRLAALRGAGQSAAAVLMLVSGGLCSLWLAVQASVDLVPVVAADDAGTLSQYDDQTLLALDLVQRVGETFGDVSTTSRGLFLLAAGLVVVRHRVLPRWIGHLALVVGGASLVGLVGATVGGPLTVVWLAGLLGFVLWVLVVGAAAVVLLMRTRARA